MSSQVQKLEQAKKVNKSWGWERWLRHGTPENPVPYAMKEIGVFAGQATSYQYHLYKSETNFVKEGLIEMWLEEPDGSVSKTQMGPGEFVTINPPQKHRVLAIKDSVMIECSTPELDDVVRVSDLYNRPSSGRIAEEHLTPCLVVLAAGLGSRVKVLSKGLGKSLLKVYDGVAAISHVINLASPDFDVVIATGFNAALLENYVLSAHSDRKVKFVRISDFESPDSGPGFSLRQCKNAIGARPFYVSTVDCIHQEKFAAIDSSNWIAVSKTDLPEIYSTAKLDGENVVDFKNKSPDGWENAFAGLCYIKDHETFWKNLGDSKELVAAFEHRENFPLKAKQLDWVDIGNRDSYERSFGKSHNLAKKLEEDTFIIGSRVVKLNSNLAINKERVERAAFLTGLTPKVSGQDYCLSYDLVPGKTLYELDDLSAYKAFIDWHFSILSPDTNFGYNPANEEAAARKFYLDKTKERLETFYHDYPDFRKLDPLKDLDWNWLLKPELTKTWHGDLQPDNIVYDGQKFVWLDWRNSFAGLFDGDAYYDLAKFYGGLSFNYLAAKDLSVFEFSQVGEEFFYKVPQTPNMVAALRYFEEKIRAEGFNLERVQVLTGLIWLNMSPLHLYPMNVVCYLEGAKMING